MPQSQNINHNLDIRNYNFQELLGLFDLTSDMTLPDLKRAKRKVLYLHPDKSRLPPQYFLFYKRAFEVIVSFYEERTKQEREVPQEPIKYSPQLNANPNHHKMAAAIKQYQSATDVEEENEKQQQFQRTFNDLFEQNMAQRPDPTRNQWFHDTNPTFQHEQATTQNLGQVMHTVKSQAAALAKYRGVENMRYSGGTSFYDDDTGEGEAEEYVSADLFSKLKYDDLRKVHKDQTVFAVSELDYDPSKRAHNIEMLSRERSTQDVTPIEKSRAESILTEQQQEYERRMFQRQHESRLRTMEYEKKNETVMGAFMRLQNG